MANDDRFIPDNAWTYNALNPGLTWYCPCGYEGKYSSVAAHRKGFRKRPACKAGRMYLLVDGDGPGVSPTVSIPEPTEADHAYQGTSERPKWADVDMAALDGDG